MRLGFDGLAARVSQVLPPSLLGHAFLFRSKRADYLKLLHYDGTGLCLFAKRLERGKFVWPPIVDGEMVLTPAQVALLLEAMDWRRTVAAAADGAPADRLIARRPKKIGQLREIAASCASAIVLRAGLSAPQPPDLPRGSERSAPLPTRSPAPSRRLAEGRVPGQGADDREAASAARRAAPRPLRALVGETRRAGRSIRIRW